MVKNYRENDRILLARELVRIGARAVFIAQALKIPPEMARDIYKKETGISPVSGQTPRDHLWFNQTTAKRKIGAEMLEHYATTSCQFRNSPERMARSLLDTYVRHLALFRIPVVDIDRFGLLVTGWRYPEDILEGKPSGFSEDNIKIMKCRYCATPFLVEDFIRQYTCPDCERRMGQYG